MFNWIDDILERRRPHESHVRIVEEIFLRNKLTAFLWSCVILVVGINFPAVGFGLFAVTIGTIVMSSFRATIAVSAEPIMAACSTMQETVTQLAEVVPNVGERMVGTMIRMNESLVDHRLSWENLLANAQQHKIGITTAITRATGAKNFKDLAMDVVVVGSLLGLERSIINSVLSRLTSTFVPATVEPELVIEVMSQAGELDEIKKKFSSSNMRKGLGVGVIACTLANVDVAGLDPFKSLKKASDNADAAEKLLLRGEELLNILGICTSGKWAYIKEIEDQMTGIRSEFEYFNNLLASNGANLCRPSEFKRWSKFRSNVRTIDVTLSKNMDVEFRKSRLYAAIQTIIAKVIVWETTIAIIRSTNGTRPTPVGVSICGPSQLGKSTLMAELCKRVQSRLVEMAEENEDLVELADAAEWTSWNVQARDDYDQGYTGQEIVRCDDGFSSRDDESHAMWLTFISPSSIGTKQAELASKGSAFLARMCVVSHNKLPTGSAFINNVEALIERFPVHIMTSLKSTAARKGAEDVYDPEFSHLDLRMTTMANSCLSKETGCNEKHKVTCSSPVLSLGEIVESICKKIVGQERKHQSQLVSLGLPQYTSVYRAPQANEPTTVSAARAEIAKHYFGAFNLPVVTSVFDPAIANWARMLKRRVDGKKWLSCLEEDEMTECPVSFLTDLESWEEDDAFPNAEILGAMVTMGSFARRYQHAVTGEHYLWGESLGGFTSLISVPVVEGLVGGSDHVSFYDLTNRFSEIVNETVEGISIESAMDEQTESWTRWGLNILRHSVDVAARIGIAVVLTPIAPMFLMLSVRRIIPPSRKFLVSTGGLTRRVMRIRGKYKWLFPLAMVADVAIALSEPLIAAWRVVAEVAEIVSNKIIELVQNLFEYLGVECGEFLDTFITFVTDVGVVTVLAVITPIVAGLIYATYCWLTAETCIPQGYESKKSTLGAKNARAMRQVPQYTFADQAKKEKKEQVEQSEEDGEEFCEVCESDLESLVEPQCEIMVRESGTYFIEGSHGRDWITSEGWTLEIWRYLKAIREHVSDQCEIETSYGELVHAEMDHLYYRASEMKNGLKHVVQITRPKICKKTKGGDSGVEWRVTLPFIEEDLNLAVKAAMEFRTAAEFLDWRLTVLMNDKVIALTFSFLSARIGGEENVKCTRSYLKKIDHLIVSFSREISEEKEKVLESLPEEVEVLQLNKESRDNGALDLITSLVDRHTVAVFCPFEEGGEALARFDVFKSKSSAALAVGKRVYLPAHLVVGSKLIKFVPLGGGRLKEVDIARYHIARVFFSEARYDIACAEILSKAEAQAVLREFDPDLLGCKGIVEAPMYSEAILKHLISEEFAERLLRDLNVFQWLPRTGVVTTGIVSFKKNQIVNYGDGEGALARTWCEIIRSHGENAITQDGDCGGLIVIADTKVLKKVVGFHVAGTRSGVSVHGALLTSDMVEKIEMWKNNVMPQSLTIVSAAACELNSAGGGHTQIAGWPEVSWAEYDPLKQIICTGHMADLPYGELVVGVGSLYSTSPPANVSKGLRDWELGPFSNEFELLMEPGPIDPRDDRIEIEVMKNRDGRPSLLIAPNSEMCALLPEPDIEVLEAAGRAIIGYWTKLLSGKRIGLDSDMSLDAILDEGMNGHPLNKHITGMTLNKSPGMPWTSEGIHKKSEFVKCGVEGERSFVESPCGRKMRALCIRKLLAARDGQRMTSFCTSKLKNCLISSKNVGIGKTRVFNAGSFEDVLVGNSLFGRFKEEYIRAGFVMGHGIGIDAMSGDWQALYDYMSVHKNAMDIDYTNYDKHQSSIMMRVAYAVIIRVIENVYPDEWAAARYVMAEQDIMSLMIDEYTVWQSEHGNKSGCCMTTVLNTVLNYVHVLYSWMKIMGSKSLDLFVENVRVVGYGDDLLITVSDEAIERFNLRTVMEVLRSLGHVVTDAKKSGGNVPTHTEIWDTQFLKREFTLLRGQVVGKLEIRSIESTFGWTQNSADAIEIWVDIVRTHLMEATMHGKAYFDVFKGKIERAVEDREFPPRLRAGLASVLVDGHSMFVSRFMSVVVEGENQSLQEWISKEDTTLFRVLDDLEILHQQADISQLKKDMITLGALLDSTTGTANLNTEKVRMLEEKVEKMGVVVAGAEVTLKQMAERVKLVEAFDKLLDGRVSKIEEFMGDFEGPVVMVSDKVVLVTFEFGDDGFGGVTFGENFMCLPSWIGANHHAAPFDYEGMGVRDFKYAYSYVPYVFVPLRGPGLTEQYLAQLRRDDKDEQRFPLIDVENNVGRSFAEPLLYGVKYAVRFRKAFTVSEAMESSWDFKGSKVTTCVLFRYGGESTVRNTRTGEKISIK